MSWEDKKSQKFVLTHGQKKTVMLKVELHVAFAPGLRCTCTACPGARSTVGYARGSCGGVTSRRQEAPPQNGVNVKKMEEGIMPSTQKSIYQVFSNELSKQNLSSCSSVPGFVYMGNCGFFCASLCVPVPASTSRVPSAIPASIRKYTGVFHTEIITCDGNINLSLRLPMWIAWRGTNPCENIWAGH